MNLLLRAATTSINFWGSTVNLPPAAILTKARELCDSEPQVPSDNLCVTEKIATITLTRMNCRMLALDIYEVPVSLSTGQIAVAMALTNRRRRPCLAPYSFIIDQHRDLYGFNQRGLTRTSNAIDILLALDRFGTVACQ